MFSVLQQTGYRYGIQPGMFRSVALKIFQLIAECVRKVRLGSK